ncbi:MAG: glutaredoxin 3 [Cellvibrionales bacterium]|nr:glutaredoxin 3 [Cellvibrionales bacterium]HCH19907.1 glutaredoxin 3 [Cellvibrionales bacterium]
MMKIEIYTTQICPYCTAAKQLLNSKALRFDEIKVDNNPSLRAEMERLSGQYTVPQIWISGSHVGGYTDLVAFDRSGRLEAMLDD